MAKITSNSVDTYKAVQPNKTTTHSIRLELNKYSSVKNENQLIDFITFFKKCLNKILISYVVEFTHEYIIVKGRFKGTEMTWRTKRIYEN